MPRKFSVNVGKVTELKGWLSPKFLNRKGSGPAVWKGARGQMWKLFKTLSKHYFFFFYLCASVMFFNDVSNLYFIR